MRTIIAGSRTVTNMRTLQRALDTCGWKPTLVLSGGARGADFLGEVWALNNEIQCIRYPADWQTHGRSAGFIRNQLMAQNAEALIALWDGNSSGTKHMISVATARGLRIYVERT